jgi:hypothetical protein
MILALALLLAAAPADTLSVKVVSLEFSYPYFGEPGNPCVRAGSVFVRGQTSDGQSVVVRLADSAGLSPGSEAVLADVRRAGAGRDGTAVFCSTGRFVARAPEPTPAPPPMVAAEVTPPAATGCTVQLFHVVKKPLGAGKFGPSEFAPEVPLGIAEPIDCSLARARNTNVLLVRMVKDGSAKPETVVGAEWEPGSKWEKEPDAPQRRVVKVYVDAASAQPGAQAQR